MTRLRYRFAAAFLTTECVILLARGASLLSWMCALSITALLVAAGVAFASACRDVARAGARLARRLR